ncbi:hypothetical protein QWZ13_05105 [Reinekea marina]|uniref:Uncharacterized protein n=1 Tax=Reinekea marina TaxID=1310421 RepID=A0ABV7WRP6_9GAMM|nr:hypothetical protein [Reinekea marina]MDN3648286.1 hypothetical protein [Reinekea marina]
MNIQIGLPCDPKWLCDAIGLVIGVIVVVGVIALVRTVLKEHKKRR